MNTQIKLTCLLMALSFSPLAACAQTSTTESTGQYIDDSTITTKVKNAILQDPDLKVFDIHVVTYKNSVQLSGFVDDQAIISRAGTIARAVNGVKNVQNNLVVK